MNRPRRWPLAPSPSLRLRSLSPVLLVALPWAVLGAGCQEPGVLRQLPASADGGTQGPGVDLGGQEPAPDGGGFVPDGGSAPLDQGTPEPHDGGPGTDLSPGDTDPAEELGPRPDGGGGPDLGGVDGGEGEGEPDLGPPDLGGCVDACPAGELRCAATGADALQRCGDGDGDACVEWLPPEPCPAGNECLAGRCQPRCVDECLPSGGRQCQGAALRTCGEYDLTDDCLEWGPPTACPAGQACDPATTTCREPCGDFCAPFSVVLLPDTQYYTSKQDDVPQNTYYKQMRWIVDHRQQDDIRFVIHLGDITNSNERTQWVIARTAHDLLDDAGIPYSVTTGNHDYLSDREFDRGGTQFDDFFGVDRFEDQPWYGGHYGSTNQNNVTFFEVGPLKFMVLSLEYAPRKDVLCWAERQIAAHPEHRVILATHCYLTHGGVYSEGCPSEDYVVPGSNGQTLWDELVSRHKNLFLVVSGHVGDSEYVPRPGNSGSTVHQMLVDYQFEVPCGAAAAASCQDHCRSSGYTGNGWLRQLVFDPRRQRVEARTITVEEGNRAVFPQGRPTLFCSPLNTNGHNDYDADPLARDHTFGFDYDLVTTTVDQREDLGHQGFNDRTVNSAGAGDQLRPVVARGLDGDFVVVWEDDSSSADGAGMHDIFVRGFAAGGCPRFADRAVHANVEGNQTTPAVAMDAQGNFVVAWADDNDGNGSFQIHARGFTTDGAERIARFTVNSAAAGQQLAPAIAMAADGRFVIAWQDDPENDGDFQIRMRGFSADGREAFSERSVHLDGEGQRRRPTVAMGQDGGFVVAWEDDSDGNDIFQIHARGFAANGGERFGRLTVNSEAAGQQLVPVAAMAPDGRFVVAWEDDADQDRGAQLLMRGFTAAGQERFSDRSLLSQPGGTQKAVSLSMLADGSFAAAWQDDRDGNGSFQIRARGFAADGSGWLSERTINRNPSGQQGVPSLAFGEERLLLVVWEDDMDGNGATQILAMAEDVR